jgi:HK97 family phage portal protein
MTLWKRMTSIFERRAMSYGDLFDLMSVSTPTYAGPPVTEENAMRSSAVYACIRIISESIAALPLVLYKQSGRDKSKATSHPLYPILHNLTNPEMTALEWRELMISHCLLCGNGYSEKDIDNGGKIRALWPLRPDKMEDLQRGSNGQMYYMYRMPDQTLRAIPSYRIHHLKGLGNGLMGFSPILQAAKQAIGLSLAAEEYGARFYSNGARPGLILRHPGKLSEQAAKRLKESYAYEHQGLSNAHRTKILEEGMDVTTIGIANNEAQFLETRKFQVTEIARIFRVPPHMLADLDRATFSNIEQQSINFVMYTLMPWLVRHEQAIYRDLLTEGERRTMFAKYNVEGMLRGDTLSRYQSYQVAVNNTILTPNEIRELEDRNPMEGGDVLFTPLNLIALGTEPAPPAAAPTVEPAPEPPQARLLVEVAQPRTPLLPEKRVDDAQRRALMNRHVRLFEDAASRAVKRESADIRKAAKSKLGKRDAESFATWLETFYKQLRSWFPDYFRNIMLTYAETMMASVAAELGGEPAPLDDEMRAWIEGYLANYTEVYAVGGEKQLRALLAEAENEEEAQTAIEERMDGWEATKAGKEGFQQAFEAGNALAIFGYASGGVSILRWSARGESCPMCRKIDGKRIKIDGAFFEAGDTVTAEGVDPLPVVRTIRHGPLHSGCDCVTVAA